MSHGIYLYDPSQAARAEPRTIAEFGDILAELQDKRPGPAAKFRQFARLLARKIAEAGEGGPDWRSDPVRTAESLASAVWNLDLPAADPVRGMRQAVDCARAAGLVAYDDETGMGFLPDGRVVPAERQQEWEDAADAAADESLVQTRTQLKRKLQHRLLEILGPRGFAIDKAVAKEFGSDVAFSRVIDGGSHQVSVKIEGASPSFRCTVHLVCYLDAVTALFEQALTKPLPLFGRTFSLELRELAGDFEASRLWLEPDPKFEATMALLEEKALPLLDRGRDASGADWLMNDPESPLRDLMKRWHTVAALSVAFLVGNPRFDALAEELVDSSRARVDGTPQSLQALLAYVRQTR